MKNSIITAVVAIAITSGAVAAWASYSTTNADCPITQECPAEVCPITGEPIVNQACPLEAAKTESSACCEEDS